MEVFLIKALQLIIALGLLVVLHEGGHFFAAKVFKVRVEKFYLFFDYKFSLFSTYSNWWRKLMGKAPAKKKENGVYEYEGTEYGVGWIPLGGYVKISGMVDESSFNEEDSNKSFWKQLPDLMKNIIIRDEDVKGERWEFRTRPAWQRLIVMLGGIFMNFVTAFIIYAMVLFTWGESFVKSEDMTHGMKFSEQAIADGFRDGDIIIKVDDEKVESWSTSVLQDISNAKTVTVLRNGSEEVITLPENMNLLDMIEGKRPYAAIYQPLCIETVTPGSPAEAVGLKTGDVITSLNGKTISCKNDLDYEILCLQEKVPENANFGDSLKMRQVTIVVNNADTLKATLTSDFMFGFVNKIPYEDKITTKEYGFFESFPAGVKYGWQTLTSYVDQMKYIFTKKGARQVGGFISIGKIFPDAWNWQKFWLLTAFLSIALGFMNLLPIPALDGGHALFAFFEMITRKRLNDNFLLVVQYFGMYILIAIMVLAQANDILRLFGF